jgi:MoxR-like ATPase
MEMIEKPLLAGLVTGEPVLLVGGHGTAKTALCRNIARDLDQPFIAYDAGKAMFEDILGFPDPSSLQKGEITYISTPVSIWGKRFVLIDELSRAAPAMQNKWLEVIRSRQIMGLKLPDLDFVFAAMNPPSYLGAHPLDEALAGRFALVIRVPEVSEVSEEAVLKIVRNVTEDDVKGARSAGDWAPKKDGAVLGDFLMRARRRLSEFDHQAASLLASYVAELASYLRARDVALDGRRLGMMWRTLQAFLCVEAEMAGAGAIDIGASGPSIAECLPHAVPFAATGQADTPSAALRAAHEASFPILRGEAKPRHLLLPTNTLDAVRIFEERHREAKPEERRDGVSRLLARTKSQGEESERVAALAGLCGMARAVCSGDLDLEPDDQYRILERYRSFTEVAEEDADEFRRELRHAHGAESEHSFLAAHAMTAFRMAYLHLKGSSRSVDSDRLVHLAEALEGVLKATGGNAEEIA